MKGWPVVLIIAILGCIATHYVPEMLKFILAYTTGCICTGLAGLFDDEIKVVRTKNILTSSGNKPRPPRY